MWGPRVGFPQGPQPTHEGTTLSTCHFLLHGCLAAFSAQTCVGVTSGPSPDADQHPKPSEESLGHRAGFPG